MPPSHLTLAKLKSGFLKLKHDLKVGVLSLEHQPSHRYLDMRQECRTSKGVTSRSCDWLFLVLAMRAQGAPLTETDGKIDDY